VSGEENVELNADFTDEENLNLLPINPWIVLVRNRNGTSPVGWNTEHRPAEAGAAGRCGFK
jgi:hypothetical protein